MIDLTADELFGIEMALFGESLRLMEQKHTSMKLGLENMVNDIECQIRNNDKLREKIASKRVEQEFKGLKRTESALE